MKIFCRPRAFNEEKWVKKMGILCQERVKWGKNALASLAHPPKTSKKKTGSPKLNFHPVRCPDWPSVRPFGQGSLKGQSFVKKKARDGPTDGPPCWGGGGHPPTQSPSKTSQNPSENVAFDRARTAYSPTLLGGGEGPCSQPAANRPPTLENPPSQGEEAYAGVK